MKEKEIDLVGKSEDEIYEAYAEISNDIEVQKMIWNETKDYNKAKEVYEKYLEKKVENNNN